MRALAQAFAHLAVVVAWDWSCPERHLGGQVVLQKEITPTEAEAMFIDLARDRIIAGETHHGFIHPQWSPRGFMFGHWGV